MSVLLSDLVLYGSSDMPEADSVTVGGAVDFTILCSFSDLTANDTVDWVSSSASDTATKAQISGRDASGTIQTPAAITLTGTTKVNGAQTFSRLEAGIITGAVGGSFPLSNPGGTTAVGDVACLKHTATISAHTAQTGSANSSGLVPALFKLQSGDGSSVSTGMIIQTTGGTGPNQLRMIVGTVGYGTDVVAVSSDWSVVPDNTTTYNINVGMLFPIGPNSVTKVVRPFFTAAADVPGGSTRTFFEKVFAVNNNASADLTNAGIYVSSESPVLPTGQAIAIGLTTALNDTHTISARQQTAGFLPAGVTTFVGQPSITVPTGGKLPSGAPPNSAGAQGIWLRYTLPAGAAAYGGAMQVATQGQTS